MSIADLKPAPILAPKPAPTAPGNPLVQAYRMRHDPIKTIDDAFAFHAQPDAITLRLGPLVATLLRSPELVRRVLVDNAANYSKNTRGYRKAKIVLGEGLVTSEGELWTRQRRIAAPAFHRQRIAALAQPIVEASRAYSPRETIDGSTDVFADMMRLTLGIAMQTLFGTTASQDDPDLARVSAAVTVVLERTNDLITNLLAPPLWVPLPSYVRFKRALAVLDEYCYRTIQQKQENPGDDLLSMLITARDESTGLGMSDRQLRDEAVTILIAGHETSACALTWAMWLLAKNQDVQSKMHAELDGLNNKTLNNKTLAFDDLPKLAFTRQIIDEAMRLYPPAWMIGRYAVKSDIVGPYTIRQGQFALISPYWSHRNPHVWENADAFDPDRFAPGRAESIPKFAYIPLGGGSRFCIGANLALMEAVLVLATIAQRYRFKLDPAAPEPKPWAMITLRPRDGLILRMEKRL